MDGMAIEQVNSADSVVLDIRLPWPTIGVPLRSTLAAGPPCSPPRSIQMSSPLSRPTVFWALRMAISSNTHTRGLCRTTPVLGLSLPSFQGQTSHRGPTSLSTHRNSTRPIMLPNFQSSAMASPHLYGCRPPQTMSICR